jgi:hypothetical protein
MLTKKNVHVWLAVAGVVVGFTMMTLVIAHNNDPTKLAILIAGALLCVLAPLASFMWTLKRKRRLHISRSGFLAVLLMVVGLLGPSRVEALVPFRLGDIFGLVFWSGFALLCFLLIRYWHTTRRQNQAMIRSGGGGLSQGG